MTNKRTILSIISLAAILIAGCGSSSSPTQPPPDNGQLITING